MNQTSTLAEQVEELRNRWTILLLYVAEASGVTRFFAWLTKRLG